MTQLCEPRSVFRTCANPPLLIACWTHDLSCARCSQYVAIRGTDCGMRSVRSNAAVASQVAKLDDSLVKAVEFGTFASPVSQKEKKPIAQRPELASTFSRHNVCFCFSCADNLLPRDEQRLSPSKGRATCTVGSPPRFPTRSPAVLFSGIRIRGCCMVPSGLSPTFLSCGFC